MKVTHATMEYLISQRLEDMAEQVGRLYAEGELELAEFLRDEALQLAQAYDNEDVILVAEALF